MNAWTWTKSLLAVALTFQTLELLWLRRCFENRGIWRESMLAQEFAIFSAPLRAVFRFVFSYRIFFSILIARLLASVALPFENHPAIALVLFFSSLIISLRFRGVFNGGSDYLTLNLTGALAFASCFHESEWAVKAALLYIGTQSLASYVIGGWVKVKNPDWRSGRALVSFVHTPNFHAPEKLKRRIPASGRMAFALSWLTLLFEMGFPALLFFPATRALALGLGVFFHLTNVYAFGLNRFFWIWIATYPALTYLCAFTH